MNGMWLYIIVSGIGRRSCVLLFFFFKQKTAYEMRISDWSSDVCSSDLLERNVFKYMLTGEDDAALITQLKPKDYATGRNAQVRMLDDMILELDAEIADSFPDVAELDDKLEALQAELGQLERELAFARDSAQAGLVQKKRLINRKRVVKG